MKKLFRSVLIVVLALVVIYLIGPKPAKSEFNKNLPSIWASTADIEEYVDNQNKKLNLKEDNEPRIIWANDSVKERTEYCLLYLPGFRACWYEGFPANVEFARYFGCNAYFALLASHGLKTDEPLIDMTPDRLWESAKEALMIARSLGKKVIIMGTSTGGTLALKLASDFPEYVDGLILYSPNIAINKSGASLLGGPWGLQLGRMLNGGKYRYAEEDSASEFCRYWYCKYRMESVVYLQQLLDETMNRKTYKNVSAPVFMGYYYKDQDHQDETVKVSAMLKMFDQLGTPSDRKVKMAFPNAGDHVIACKLTSGSVDKVILATEKFGEEVLNLKPVKQPLARLSDF